MDANNDDVAASRHLEPDVLARLHSVDPNDRDLFSAAYAKATPKTMNRSSDLALLIAFGVTAHLKREGYLLPADAPGWSELRYTALATKAHQLGYYGLAARDTLVTLMKASRTTEPKKYVRSAKSADFATVDFISHLVGCDVMADAMSDLRLLRPIPDKNTEPEND